MTTHRSNSRRVWRYLSASACIALVTLYVASQRWNFFLQVPLFSLEIMGGVLDLHRGGVTSSSITRHDFPWRHAYSASGGTYWELKFPLYIPLIPVTILTAWAWAGHPRARRHLSPRSQPGAGQVQTG